VIPHNPSLTNPRSPAKLVLSLYPCILARKDQVLEVVCATSCKDARQKVQLQPGLLLRLAIHLTPRVKNLRGLAAGAANLAVDSNLVEVPTQEDMSIPVEGVVVE